MSFTVATSTSKHFCGNLVFIPNLKNLKLKKSFGQHFLHNESICMDIVEAIHCSSGRLLEIGPGGGAITKYLLKKTELDYKAVELDKEKVDYLLHQFPGFHTQLIHKDFLKMEKPFDQTFSIIGNFPYNISTQIMFRVLEWRDQVEELVGMFQKEVAVRIAASHGKKDYGILSVLTQCFYQLEYLFDVPPSSFTPPPKVNSGVIRMVRKETALITEEEYDDFKTFVKLCFNQRRKTLRNGLKSSYASEQLQDKQFDLRAEQVSVEGMIEMFRRLK